MLQAIQLPVLTDNYIYIVHDPVSAETAVIDPAMAEPVLDFLNQKGWKLKYVLNTHHHADHVSGNMQLKNQTGCLIVGSSADKNRIPGIDIGVQDGDAVNIGENSFKVFATPGHTSQHIVFYSENNQLLFSGDTLFALGCGRLFEGTAQQMWQSLAILKNLPDATQIYCAHEYTLANAKFALTIEPDNQDLIDRYQTIQTLRQQNLSTLPSTIGLEKATNPFFRENSPSIRHKLGCSNQEPAWQVFSKIRKLKDNFN